MHSITRFTWLLMILILAPSVTSGQNNIGQAPQPDTITFTSGHLKLKGFLYTPEGHGPFPAMIFNHGSEAHPDRWVSSLAKAFVDNGYVFFVPFRRGQGLSTGQGKSIRSVMDSAFNAGGDEARVSTMIRLHESEQLQDQLSALTFLKQQAKADPNRIAVMGVSFGGIQTLLIATRPVGIKCALDFAGAAMNWDKSPRVGEWLTGLAPMIQVPVYFIQAENDFSIRPSKELYAAFRAANKPCEMKIYPPQGTKPLDGHAMGTEPGVWFPEVLPWINEMVGK